MSTGPPAKGFLISSIPISSMLAGPAKGFLFSTIAYLSSSAVPLWFFVEMEISASNFSAIATASLLIAPINQEIVDVESQVQSRVLILIWPKKLNGRYRVDAILVSCGRVYSFFGDNGCDTQQWTVRSLIQFWTRWKNCISDTAVITPKDPLVIQTPFSKQDLEMIHQWLPWQNDKNSPKQWKVFPFSSFHTWPTWCPYYVLQIYIHVHGIMISTWCYA